MNTKTIKIIYWISTSLISLMMIFSAYSYFTNPEVKQGFQHLGFSDYFRIELGIAKLLGAIILIAPIKGQIKEWAYAGFAITFISAFIAHAASGDPVSNQIGPIVFLLVLALSYFTYRKSKTVVSVNQI
ncbi:DoxX family protein [Pedobacter chinensis]|uniref:DoxX family protein n=1 Tax=Pedobacter chinensis TaxID=2282421 RepID=A0A369PY63_9SPHI|nr:DoxX family protein [Pedobacter chinensis]RDC57212.1 DoxX family protein [Pedobacter chinensis]